MNDEDFDNAHEVLELFQGLVISIGTTLLQPLSAEQREYVLVKMHDEFRFWGVEDELK